METRSRARKMNIDHIMALQLRDDYKSDTREGNRVPVSVASGSSRRGSPGLGKSDLDNKPIREMAVIKGKIDRI